jgi:lipopolysaccharide/colanic/teichoic acid biosynthesis glycosyltransferase
MIKRLFDMATAAIGLLLASPVLLVIMLLVWKEDRYSPFYIAPRVGRGGGEFRMVKMRSMRINADREGGSSTSNSDRRITPVGHFIRRYKIDEFTQLWNVLVGDMSLVGPRPQVQSGVAMYTQQERELLHVRPGITDLASIVFADEGTILQDSKDPDGDYDRLIRPWKSRLGLIYVHRHSVFLDIRLVFATLVAIGSRRAALRQVQSMLRRLDAPADVMLVAAREHALVPGRPPDGDFSPKARGSHEHGTPDVMRLKSKRME